MKKYLVALMILSVTSTCYAQPINITASWYSEASLIKEGTRKVGERQVMANGQRFDETRNTCASRLYLLGTRLKVTNKRTGSSVIVTVTDRIGKRFAKTRIDLSKGAFSKIADLKQGLIQVEIKELL